jgi:hypothetical protein
VQSYKCRVQSWVFLFVACAALAGQAAQFKPLWDGKTLEGWHPIGKGHWKIEEGTIHGMHGKSEKQYGHLVTDRSFTNFTVRLKFKSVKGNSGLYFRTEEKGWGGVSGFQAEIDPQNDIGGLYETNGRGWVVQPKAADVKEWFKPGDWNEMRIEAIGSRITVYINGHKTAHLADDKRGRPDGKLALQLHGNQEVDVWFKEIEIVER